MAGSNRILVIDDELFCETTEHVLKDIGYQPVLVTDVAETCGLFSDNPGQFDLVIVDHLLAGQGGTELAGALLQVRSLSVSLSIPLP